MRRQETKSKLEKVGKGKWDLLLPKSKFSRHGFPICKRSWCIIALKLHRKYIWKDMVYTFSHNLGSTPFFVM